MSKEHAGLRLEKDEIERVDALVKAMSKPGWELNRSKVLRALVLYALTETEQGRGIRRPDVEVAT
jgi:hypothetical protein